MNLSVRTKLFLTLLLASLLAVVGTSLFVGWSMQRGLAELVDARESERIEAVADRLLALYAKDGSWEPLSKDIQLWVSVLRGRDRRKDTHPDRLPPWLRHHRDQPGLWPPGRAMKHFKDGDRPVPLEFRLMLLDRAGIPIYGQASLLEDARRVPLIVEGTQVGALALVPGPPLAELPELQFQARQGGRLWVIAAGMVLISAMLAYPLSSRLVRPLRGFQETARRLGAGDFTARAPDQPGPRGRDEIAQLGRDINGLAAALEQHEQSRQRWVADISHEMRTPVTLLRAELEALQDGVRPLERAAIDALHGDVLRLGRLVEDLYQLSMTDLGALSYRMEPTDVGELIAADLEGFRPRFNQAGLGLDLQDHRSTPAEIQADPGRLSQLFHNLLRNSLQYTDPGGRLEISLTQSPGSVLIDFQDTAPGVPTEALPKLFDRLYRLDESRSRHTGGAGLGLAIAKNIVQAHGGDIWAAQSIQGGLWIHIELPS